MLKLSHDNAMRSSLMFLVDEQIESKYESLYEKEMPKYDSLLSIRTKEDLQSFIKNELESIKLLTTILGISGEKLADSKVRTELCDSKNLMDEFCDLFFNKDVFKDLIPRSILNDFRLDREWLIHVCSKDMLLKMIKTSYTTAYNGECANAYQEKVTGSIKAHTDKYGLSFGKVVHNAILKSESLFTISNGEKSIIVTINYTVTTSNNQTRYSEKIQKIRSAIAGNRNYMLINILDGAGWVARGSDYQKIHTDCSHFLNLANIDRIETIITEYFNIQ